MTGVEWVIPGIAIASVVGNAVVTYRAVGRHETLLKSHDDSIREHDTYIAIQKDRDMRKEIP